MHSDADKISFLMQKIEKMQNVIVRMTKDIDALAEAQLYLFRQSTKHDDCYYHIFPERLAQDAKFESQIDSITGDSKPDGKPNK